MGKLIKHEKVNLYLFFFFFALPEFFVHPSYPTPLSVYLSLTSLFCILAYLFFHTTFKTCVHSSRDYPKRYRG